MRLERIVTITGISRSYPSRTIEGLEHHSSNTVDETSDDRKQRGDLPKRHPASDETATTQELEESPAPSTEPRALDITV